MCGLHTENYKTQLKDDKENLYEWAPKNHRLKGSVLVRFQKSLKSLNGSTILDCSFTETCKLTLQLKSKCTKFKI